MCTFYVACQPEYRQGLYWERSRTNQLTRIRCSKFHPSFHSTVYITRMCNTSGGWEDVDFSDCTMRIRSTPIVIIEINRTLVDLNTSVLVYEVSMIDVINVRMYIYMHVYAGCCICA